MAVSRRLRFEILRRDDHTCRYCGASAPDVKLEVDHVLPVSLGGTDEPSNLVTACVDCNRGKSSANPDAAIVEDVNVTAMAMAEAMRQVAREMRDQREALDADVECFDEVWNSFSYPNDVKVSRPGDWRTSVERFLSLGLMVEDLERFVRVAMTDKRVKDENVFGRFCGQAWRAIREIQSIAADRVNGEGDAT